MGRLVNRLCIKPFSVMWIELPFLIQLRTIDKFYAPLKFFTLVVKYYNLFTKTSSPVDTLLIKAKANFIPSTVKLCSCE